MPADLQPLDPACRHLVGVTHAYHDAGNTCVDERLGARRGAADVVARLERHVDGCATRGLSCIAQREHLGMRLAGARVEALAHDASVGDDDAANQGIGRSRATATLGHGHGTGQVRVIDPGCDV